MKKIMLMLAVLFLNTQAMADHFPEFPPFPVTAIKAHTIYEGDEILFGYGPGRYPCLHSLPNFEGKTEYIEIIDNNIEITISAFGSFPCFDLDTDLIAYEFYKIGTLIAGEYNIQMYWTDSSTPLPVPPNLNRSPIGESVQFEIHSPKSIPYLSFHSLFLLSTTVIAISLSKFQRRT